VPATVQGSPQELVDDAFGIVEEAMVGDAQDPIAQGSQKDISVGVVRGLQWLLMNIAIELHDETEVVTAKISHEGGNGELAPELEAMKAAVAEQFPHCGLCWRSFPAQLTSPRAHLPFLRKDVFRHTRSSPHRDPIKPIVFREVASPSPGRGESDGRGGSRG
jgi:hypothetical protein